MSYNLNQTIKVGDLIELLADATETDQDELIEALVGTAFDEEESMQVRGYLRGTPEGEAS